MEQELITFLLSSLIVTVLIIAFLYLRDIKEKADQKRFQKEKQKKQELQKLPQDKELKQMESQLNKLKETKGPKVASTDKQESFDSLIQQAEYHHWQLTQANKCSVLLDKYYAYRAETEKAASRRIGLTYLGFFFSYLTVFFCFTRFVLHKDADILESLEMLGALSIVAFVVAGIHFFVNYYIFDQIDTSGLKDIALTFLGFMAFYLIIFVVIASITNQSDTNSDSLVEMLEHIIMFAGIASALHVWINHSIFYSIKKKDEDACQTLKALEDKIRSVGSTIDTHRPIKESITIWKANFYNCINKLNKL